MSTEYDQLLIGEPVMVVSDYRYGEWCNIPLFVAGVCFKPNGDLDYTVTEHLPPRHLGDMTDGFSRYDLMRRPE